MLDDVKFLEKAAAGASLRQLDELPAQLQASHQALVRQPWLKPPTWCLLLAKPGSAELAARLYRESQPVPGLIYPRLSTLKSWAALEPAVIILGRLDDRELAAVLKAGFKPRQILLIDHFQQAWPAAWEACQRWVLPVADWSSSLYLYYQGLGLALGGEVASRRVSWAALKQAWGRQTPTAQNLAKQLAYECLGKTPVILAHRAYAQLATKWQLTYQQLNQQLAWLLIWSRRNPAALEAWRRQLFDKNYLILQPKLPLSAAQQASLSAAQRQLSGVMPVPLTIEPLGDKVYERYLSLSLFSDYLSLYISLLRWW